MTRPQPRIVALATLALALLLCAPPAAGVAAGPHATAAAHRRTHRRGAHGRRVHRRGAHRRHGHPARTAPAPAAASSYCAGADLTPNPEDLASVRAATLCLINGERTRNGVPALVASARLEAAAEGHSQDMVAQDYFEHVSPGGSTPLSRVRASGFFRDPDDGYIVAENLAWGSESLATPRSIVASWMASPGHRANILYPQLRDTGIGIAPAIPESLAEGEAGATYTEDFATAIAP